MTSASGADVDVDVDADVDVDVDVVPDPGIERGSFWIGAPGAL
jgi:hypothetical protein